MKLISALGFLGAFVALPAVNAATVSIDTPDFLLEYNDAQAGLDLWGMPHAVSGSVSFLPVNFAAIATGIAAEVDTANATVQFTLTAKPGLEFAGFNWFESGDYIRLLSAAPDTGVFVDGQLQVFDQDTGDRSVQGFSVSDLSATGFNLDWEANAAVGTEGFSESLTKVTVTLENDLLAYVVDGQIQAKIEKKFGQLLVGTTAATPIPVPPAAFMFMGAIVALVGVARRKTA